MAALLVAIAASGLTLFFVSRHSARGCENSTMYRITATGNLLDSTRHVIAVVAAGDLFVVGKRSTGPYTHRLFGINESTGQQGFIDEAKIDRLRQTCVGTIR